MTALAQPSPSTRPRASLSPGMGFAGLSFAANAVVVLVSAVVTSRLYGIEVIGRYALAMTPWLLLVSFSTVSEQIAMIRMLATMRRGSPEASGVFYAVLTMSWSLTAVMSLPVLGISALVLHGVADQPRSLAAAAIIVAGYVAFENPAWNLDSVLSAFSEGRKLFWCRLTTVVAFLVLSVALYPLTENVFGLALASVGSFAVGLVARLVAVRGLIRVAPGRAHYVAGLRQLPSMLRFGVALLPGQLFIGLTLQAPLWLIAGSVGIRDIGAFSRASTMAVRLNEASFRINEMLFPHLVRLREAGDTQAFAGTLERSLRLALSGLLLAAALAGGAARPVMEVFGDGFDEAANALVFLLLAHVGYVVCSVLAAAYNAMGKPQWNSALSAVRCVAGLGLVVVLTWRYGITGTAMGLFAGYALELVVRVAALRPALGLRRSDILSPATAARLAVVFAGAFVAGRFATAASTSTVVSLVLAVAACLAAFAGLALVTGLIDAHDRGALGRRIGARSGGEA